MQPTTKHPSNPSERTFGADVEAKPLPPISDVSAAQLVETARHDKKVVAGRLHFVLPTAIGATTTVTDVTPEELRQALAGIGLAE